MLPAIKIRRSGDYPEAAQSGTPVGRN